MCDKRSTVNLKLSSEKTVRVDPCIREHIAQMNKNGFETLACCCGHGIYPRTVVVKVPSGKIAVFYDPNTLVYIPRTRNFYKKDENGFYYIPEVQNSLHSKDKEVEK
jgi:hypothetical protein